MDADKVIRESGTQQADNHGEPHARYEAETGGDSQVKAPNSAVVPSSWARIGLGILQNAHLGLALLALVVYAIVRIGYDTFYDELGLAPEEVGVTYVTALTRAVIGLLAGAGFFLIVQLSQIPQLLAADPKLRRHAGPAVAGLVLMLVAGNLAGYLVNSRGGWGSLFSSTAGSVGIGGTVFGLSLAGWAFIKGQRDQHASLPEKTNSGSAVLSPSAMPANLGEGMATFAGLLAVVIVLSTTSVVYAQAQAIQVRRGQALDRDAVSQLFDFRADPVCAIWIGSDQPTSVDLSRSLIFLGKADNVAVLYRGGNGVGITPGHHSGAIRLPMAKIVLIPAQRDAVCK